MRMRAHAELDGYTISRPAIQPALQLARSLWGRYPTSIILTQIKHISRKSISIGRKRKQRLQRKLCQRLTRFFFGLSRGGGVGCDGLQQWPGAHCDEPLLYRSVTHGNVQDGLCSVLSHVVGAALSVHAQDLHYHCKHDFTIFTSTNKWKPRQQPQHQRETQEKAGKNSRNGKRSIKSHERNNFKEEPIKNAKPRV